MVKYKIEHRLHFFMHYLRSEGHYVKTCMLDFTDPIPCLKISFEHRDNHKPMILITDELVKGGFSIYQGNPEDNGFSEDIPVQESVSDEDILKL